MLRKLFLWLAASFAPPALALDGEVIVHDPSTVIFHGGRYYTYGTGTGLPILTSEDGSREQLPVHSRSGNSRLAPRTPTLDLVTAAKLVMSLGSALHLPTRALLRT